MWIEVERRLVGREGAEARFERLYAEHGRPVLAYAVRRASEDARQGRALDQVLLGE